jgi:hypothetical protein
LGFEVGKFGSEGVQSGAKDTHLGLEGGDFFWGGRGFGGRWFGGEFGLEG